MNGKSRLQKYRGVLCVSVCADCFRFWNNLMGFIRLAKTRGIIPLGATRKAFFLIPEIGNRVKADSRSYEVRATRNLWTNRIYRILACLTNIFVDLKPFAQRLSVLFLSQTVLKCTVQVCTTSVQHKCTVQVYKNCTVQVYSISVHHKCTVQLYNTSVQ